VRFVIVLLVALAGCVATLPDDPRISADLAVETARGIVQLRAAPDAKPEEDKPKPGDKCPPCNGTGKLPTDGRVVVQCGACGGTGRVK
jgi:hypothetical protein